MPFVQPAPESRQDALHPAVANPMPFGEEWTFDTFIGNGKHKWALSLARDITRRAVYRATHGRAPSLDDIGEAPGLLVLCGPHGTGKTHLSGPWQRTLPHARERSLLRALGDLESLFAGFGPRRPAEHSPKEAVLIDDFQHLSRIPDKTPTTASRFRAQLVAEPEQPAGPSVREELCLLLDRFMDQGKPVIVAGVGRPKEWSLGKALLSRLETGLWAELPEPDLDVRLRYAQQQAKFRRLPLSREQLLLIAQHCPDVRRLSGVILRVASHRSLLGRDLSEQDLLNIVRQGGDSSALTPQLIVSIVGEHCGVPAKEILGEKRRPDLVQARQLAMYLCRELLGHSYPVIGRMFGGKDHSTVMHGVKKIKLLQESDRLAHSMVTELTKACLEHRG
ncbi:MAG: helix-turn-helix domain-containing protein [Bilophila wadsworthia]